MSEEALKQSVEEETTQESKLELSPVEEKAMAQGWRPQDEWDGDPDDWIDAKTFVRNGEFMSRIQKQSQQLISQSSEINELKSAIKKLGEHNKTIAEKEFNRAMAALRREKANALEERDHEAVMEIDDQIDELKSAKKELLEDDSTSSKTEETPQVDPKIQAAFQSWVVDNDWYNKDDVMAAAADRIGIKYAQSNPHLDFKEVLNYVTVEITKKFPNEFKAPASRGSGSVTESRGVGRTTGKKKYTQKDLSEEQLQFAKTFVAAGAFDNVQQYVDQLVETGELQ